MDTTRLQGDAAILLIAVWMCLAVSICAVLFRMLTRFLIRHAGSWDDSFAVAALVFSITQSSLIIEAVRHGQGRPLTDLSPEDVNAIGRYEYPANFFYILILLFGKLCVCWLVLRLAVDCGHRILIYSIILLTVVNTVWALFGVAFAFGGVKGHQRFRLNASSPIGSVWLAFSIIDLVIEVVLIATPSIVLWSVRVPRATKVRIQSAFVFRLIVVATSIARLFYLPYGHPGLISTGDVSKFDVLTQIVPCMSITTACILCLKPFLDAFDSRFFGYEEGVYVANPDRTIRSRSSETGSSRGNNLRLTAMRPNKEATDLEKLTGRTVVGESGGTAWRGSETSEDIDRIRHTKGMESSADSGIYKSTNWTVEYKRHDEDRRARNFTGRNVQ